MVFIDRRVGLSGVWKGVFMTAKNSASMPEATVVLAGRTGDWVIERNHFLLILSAPYVYLHLFFGIMECFPQGGIRTSTANWYRCGFYFFGFLHSLFQEDEIADEKTVKA
jgi:hypothetical protein